MTIKYEVVSKNSVLTAYIRIDVFLEDMLTQGSLPFDMYKNLKVKEPCIFGIPKVHKQTLPLLLDPLLLLQFQRQHLWLHMLRRLRGIYLNLNTC